MVGEGAGDGGGAAGHAQPFVDVLQVGAHGSLGNAQAAGDLGVGVPGGHQAQQLPLPGGEPGDGIAAPLGIQEGLVQVRTQQRKHRPVTLGEVEPGPPAQVQPDVPLRPGGPRRRFGQCGINYADGSVWKQTVTVTSDSHGNPVADSANLGTEVLQPTDGQL
jgi:hypothetical protein